MGTREQLTMRWNVTRYSLLVVFLLLLTACSSAEERRQRAINAMEGMQDTASGAVGDVSAGLRDLQEKGEATIDSVEAGIDEFNARVEKMRKGMELLQEGGELLKEGVGS